MNVTPQQITDGIVSTFYDFLEGTRVFYLIHRNKEGGGNESHDNRTKKIITRNREEAMTAILELATMLVASDKPYRIQTCVNARDVEKGIKLFKQRQLDADYYDTDSKHGFYLDVKNRWLSSLMNPTSRAETNFLFDCDSHEELSETLELLTKHKIDILKMYKTKNGSHVVTKPHDPSLTSTEKVKPNKDGLLLLYWKDIVQA